MTNPKTKYILSSAAVLALGFASAIGAVNIISNTTSRALAIEENLPHCTNVKLYEKWDGYNDYDVISSPINVTEDIIASYYIPDQTERCKVEINLNGHTVSEAYSGRYGVRNSIDVGRNAVVIVNGDGGKFAVGSPEDPDPCTTYPDGTQVCNGGSVPALGGASTNGIDVNNGGELYLNDVTVEGEGDSVYVSNGVVVANNVIATSSMWNNGGDLTINGGTYSGISAKGNATTTVNDGTFRSIRVESGSNMVLNGGTLLKWNGEPGGTIKSVQELTDDNVPFPGYDDGSTTNDITINGGDYANLTIKSPVTITGGNFENTTIELDANIAMPGDYVEVTYGPDGEEILVEHHIADMTTANISGGNFSNSNIKTGTTISGGTFTDTTITKDATVTNGTFENTTFSGHDTNISNGTFEDTNITGKANITGGSFDTIPTASSLPDDKKVIENDDGSYSVVDESTPGEDPIKPCEVRIYTDETNYITVTGAINLDSDTIASYVVEDQDDTCRFVINLNGNKLTSVENMEAVNIGSNVSAKINGENGSIEQSNTETTPSTGTGTGTSAPAAIVVKDEGAISIKDASITTNTDAPGVSNSGRTTLNNVTTGEGTSIQNNDGGDLTINSGSYSNITSTDSGSVTINGGDIDEVVSNNNSEVTINDGDFTGSNITSTEGNQSTGTTTPTTGSGSVTINGGNFEDTNINTQTTITGGDFTGANINAPATISGGTFEGTVAPAGSEVTGGTFDTLPSEETLPENTEIIIHDDGTFEIRSTGAPTSGASGTSGTSSASGTSGTTTPELVEDERTAATAKAPEVPNTGIFSTNEKGGKQFFIGAVVAVESIILAICGYALYHLRKLYRVSFRHR